MVLSPPSKSSRGRVARCGEGFRTALTPVPSQTLEDVKIKTGFGGACTFFFTAHCRYPGRALLPTATLLSPPPPPFPAECLPFLLTHSDPRLPLPDPCLDVVRVRGLPAGTHGAFFLPSLRLLSRLLTFSSSAGTVYRRRPVTRREAGRQPQHQLPASTLLPFVPLHLTLFLSPTGDLPPFSTSSLERRHHGHLGRASERYGFISRSFKPVLIRFSSQTSTTTSQKLAFLRTASSLRRRSKGRS